MKKTLLFITLFICALYTQGQDIVFIPNRDIEIDERSLDLNITGKIENGNCYVIFSQNVNDAIITIHHSMGVDNELHFTYIPAETELEIGLLAYDVYRIDIYIDNKHYYSLINTNNNN